MKNDIPNIPNYPHISELNVNFITSFHHIMTLVLSQDCPGSLRSIFADFYWWTFRCSIQKMHISEYVCKTFENFLAASNFSKNTGFPQFFSKVSDNCILRTSIS